VVKKALEGLDGIKEAIVSFKEKRADVLYDPQKVTVEDMVSAISRVGFRAKLIGGEGGGS
jgi:copper chaperone CopZ